MPALRSPAPGPSTAAPSAFRRFAPPVVTAAMVLIGLYAGSPNFRFTSGSDAAPPAGDFLQEWIGGRVVLQGDRGRLYHTPYTRTLQHDEQLVGVTWDENQYLPMVYPPFYYAAVGPLSRLPFRIAAWVWAGLMCAALGGAVMLLGGWISRHGDERIHRWAPWAIPAAVLYAPLLESLSSSQKGTVCLMLLTATFVLWQRGRPLAAGMVFGLLAFKPQLTLVIAVAAVCKRQGRFVAGGLATGAALAGVSLWLGGDVCRQYVEFALGAGRYMEHTGYDLHKSHSVWGFGRLLAGGAGGAGPASSVCCRPPWW